MSGLDAAAANKFIQYMEVTWIGTPCGKAPQYPLQLWNCHERTKQGLPRTNNFSEGGNNALRVVTGADHPTLWKSIEKLKEFQIEVNIIYMIL